MRAWQAKYGLLTEQGLEGDGTGFGGLSEEVRLLDVDTQIMRPFRHLERCVLLLRQLDSLWLPSCRPLQIQGS